MGVGTGNRPLPPQSIEAEQALIGAAMLDPKAWSRVANHVSAEDFHRSDHRLTWAVVCATQRDGLASDAVTVSERLSRLGQLEVVGGLPYLARLVEETPSAANIESYARIVREHSTLRRLLELSQQMSRSIYDRGERRADELVAEAGELILRLRQRSRIGRGLVESRTLISELIDDLDRRHAGEHGLSVGLADFDKLTHGLEPGDLAVFAGRPGLGKTALLVCVAAHVSRDLGVTVFSAEMPAKQLMRRCVALLGSVPQGRLRHADTLTDDDWSAVSDATGQLAGRRLWIDDTAAPQFSHVRAEVLALKARTELGLVLIDYAQLLQGRGDNRYEQLRDVAYGAKNLAKDACVPVILLAQLNRGVENRDNKRARLADLRDSGAIEEAADVVGLLYSESYYNPDFPMPNVLECAIEKNRNGERGLCLWHFAGEYSRICVLEEGARKHYQHLLAKTRGLGIDDL